MRPSGYTKQVKDSPDEDMMGTRVSLARKFVSAVGAYPCFPAPLPIPGTVPHWVLSRQQAAAVSLVQPSYPVYGMAQSGAGAHHGFIAVPKQETLAGGEESKEDGEGENELGTKPTKYTGVYVEADRGKYGVKVVAKDKEGKKITKRVGAYTTIEEAAYCYAAAAHVLRPGKGTRNSVALTSANKAALKGCTPEILKVMVDARMWWRWRLWRETYEGLMQKAARTKKNAKRAKRGRPRKGSGDQGGGTAREGEGEKAGSEDTVISLTMETSVAFEDTGNAGRARRVSQPPAYLRAAYQLATPRGRMPWGTRGTALPKRLAITRADAGGKAIRDGNDDNTGGETLDASPGRVGKQALVSDSPDSRSKSDAAPRMANRNRGEDVEGGKQAHIVSNINASEEEDDEDVGDAMRTMFETNAYRENDAVDTHGEEVRVSAGVFRSLLKSQDESAQKVAHLETLLLEALAKSDGGSRRRKAERQRDPGQGCMNPKRQHRGEAVADVEEDDDKEDDNDYEDMAQIRTRRKHMRSAKSPVLQRALDLLPADKAWKRLCELVRVQLFLKKPAATMTFYPSSDDKTYGVCAVIDCLPHSFACLALAADKSRRADLNTMLSEWKTRAAGLVRDIALPKLGFFCDERDEASPWARDNARTLEQIRERIGLGAEESGKWCSGAFRHCIMYWEQRMGRLSNPAGWNSHVVNGLKVLVKGSVSQAIRHFNPEYDDEKEEWIWGRHGLRLSACGLENMKPNAGASGGDVSGNVVQSVSVGGV
ncbi:unnamed protein product [Closterium sp. NIES-65]|nr:unnamed protein product [Closterium sp. NIES-65]